MTIATLIAAARLDDRLVAAAIERLVAAGLAARLARWIDRGDAADLEVVGEGAAIRAALGGFEAIDVVAHRSARREVGLFVADMDSTMIGQECIDELADYAGLKAEVAAVTERAMQGELDFRAALAERVVLLRGLEEAALGRCLAERVRPNPGAATLVSTLRARGATTVLVTGGFTAFAEPIAERLGFDRLVANRLDVKSGRLTGATSGTIVDGARKAAVLEATRAELGLDCEQVVAIGDGANDSAMIAAAGLGIGYRAKPALAAVADGSIEHHPLSALLWVLGISRRDWVVSD